MVIIPPVDIFLPTEDGEPRVLEISVQDSDSDDHPNSSDVQSAQPEEDGLGLHDAATQFDPYR